MTPNERKIIEADKLLDAEEGIVRNKREPLITVNEDSRAARRQLQRQVNADKRKGVHFWAKSWTGSTEGRVEQIDSYKPRKLSSVSLGMLQEAADKVSSTKEN